MRTTLTEIYTEPCYTDSNGIRVWTDRYGDVVRRERNGVRIFDGFSRFVSPGVHTLEYDVNTFDVSDMLSRMLSEQISAQIDQEIITMLVNES